jgi:TRAP-type mannitol/chloroaromatic compound transport system substrate-binding protein
MAAPAIAQSSPEIRWRLTASWPKSLDALYGGAEHFARHVAAATGNKFQIQVFAAGDIVPGLQATDAVSSGTVELAHTAPYYMWSKDPTFAFGAAVPFGLNGRMQNAWWHEGSGEALMNAFYTKYNIHGLLAGNTGAQMGGWFRKELITPDDLKGVKMRIGGFGAAVISKVGMVPQQMAGGDIYPALEKGTIDAAEWVGPYDDEKLGFYKVAKFYYYPGWWEGGAMIHIHVNKEKWDALPKNYKAILTAAAAQAHDAMFARYDAQNPLALKRLIAHGTQLRPFSESILDACFRAANEVYAEISAKNDDFNKIWESIKAFRHDQYLWLQVADSTYDNYMMIQQRKKTI